MPEINFLSGSDGAVAIRNAGLSFSYGQLSSAIRELSAIFESNKIYGIILDNSIEWVLIDLAASYAGVVFIPLPTFFSKEQINHAIEASKINFIITKDKNTDFFVCSNKKEKIRNYDLFLFEVSRAASNGLSDVSKVTFTSGSTGSPKGVCLSLHSMLQVAASLKSSVNINKDDCHICLLPLSILLENIAGVYAPLLSGAEIYIPGSEEVGLLGSSNLNIEKMFYCIKNSNATTAIMTPQILKALIFFMEAKKEVLPSLRFLAVGGATVGSTLHRRAERLNLPVYEGYGLSECSSVVSLNSPENFRKNSVGKVLKHLDVKVASDGEILIKGDIFSGYLNENIFNKENEYFKTGDIGFIDDDGFLFISGRKKNKIITSFGRNIEPEWIESELCAHDMVLQAAVFGESRPYLIAVIVLSVTSKECDLCVALEEINKNFPDYAKIKKYIIADFPFDRKNGMLTGSGKINREKIYSLYFSKICKLYDF